MHTAIRGDSPKYINDILMPNASIPVWNLHSTDSFVYNVPCCGTLSKRAFSITGPHAWNELPMNLYQYVYFKCKFKTYLLALVYM